MTKTAMSRYSEISNGDFEAKLQFIVDNQEELGFMAGELYSGLIFAASVELDEEEWNAIEKRVAKRSKK